MKWFIIACVTLLTLLTASAARAEPVRLLISAGHNDGLEAERHLKYADLDAKRVRDVMVSLGGIRPGDAIVLSRPSRQALFTAIERARSRAVKHSPSEVTLIFYFSGHGDREAIHLGADRVLLTELSERLNHVPAALRISVTDACRANREKGFASDAPFTVTAPAIPQASGQVWLHASSDGEAAQESDSIKGALFTHAWLNGLKGAADANGDSRVTLDESFAFAHAQTMIRSAKSSGVLQKPEAIVRLRESAPVVLTATSNRVARVSLPQSKDAHYLVYSASGKSIVAELWSSPVRKTTLLLPPGHYIVQRRAGAARGAAKIAVAAGEERDLGGTDFSATTDGLLMAQKGTGKDSGVDQVKLDKERAKKHHELFVGYATGANTRTGFLHGPRAGYAFEFGYLALAVGGGADFTSRALETTTESLTTGFGCVGLEAHLPVGFAFLRAGLGARAGYLAQRVEPNEFAPQPASTSQNGAFIMGPDAIVGATTPLGTSSLFAGVLGSGQLLFLREEGSMTSIPGATGSLIFGGKL